MNYVVVCGSILMTSVVGAQEKANKGQTTQEFAAEVNKYLLKHSASVAEDLTATSDALKKLSADVEAQTRTIQGLESRMNGLERSVSTLTAENVRLKRQSAKLTSQLIAEQKLRASGDLKLAKNVTSVLRAAHASAPSVPRREIPTVVVKRYTVQSGDVLGNIAQAFNTTVQKIQKLNKLKNTTIRPGQVLVIPGS